MRAIALTGLVGCLTLAGIGKPAPVEDCHLEVQYIAAGPAYISRCEGTCSQKDECNRQSWADFELGITYYACFCGEYQVNDCSGWLKYFHATQTYAVSCADLEGECTGGDKCDVAPGGFPDLVWVIACQCQ